MEDEPRMCLSCIPLLNHVCMYAQNIRPFFFASVVGGRSFYEKLRAGQEDDLDGAELAEASDDDGGGPKALTVIQLAKVLKPYFWPKCV